MFLRHPVLQIDVGGCSGRGGSTVVPEATHGMTTTRQNTKFCAFLVRACPTAEQDCPVAAVGVGPPAEDLAV
jgi:hypothetical protein